MTTAQQTTMKTKMKRVMKREMRRAMWGLTGMSAAGGSRPIPPCGQWQRRMMADAWSRLAARKCRSRRGAGGRRWRYAGS